MARREEQVWFPVPWAKATLVGNIPSTHRLGFAR